MTTAIGVVMTEHIVAGRMENHQLVGEPVRYPGDSKEVDALTVIPGRELLEILANHITELAGKTEKPIEAIGVAVPGVVRLGVVEDAPNLTQIKGMRMAEELARVLPSVDCLYSHGWPKALDDVPNILRAALCESFIKPAENAVGI